MRPKSALDYRVMSLHYELPPISKAQCEYGYRRLFVPTGMGRKKKIWCTECGCEFNKTTGELNLSLFGCTCPECGAKIKITSSRQRVYKPQSQYYTIITTCKEFQVLRNYIVDKSSRVGSHAEYSCSECFQIWINDKGVEKIVALPTDSRSFEYDRWCWSSRMELRSDSSFYQKYHLFANAILRERLLPRLKYVRIPSNYYGVTPDILLKLILKYPFVETLIKNGQSKILPYMEYNTNMVVRLWPSFKVAYKHGLRLTGKEDIPIYFDYLEMCEQIGRDVKSPKYLVPVDLKMAHDEALKIKKRNEEKILLEQRMKESRKFEKMYLSAKAKFIGLAFGDDDVHIHVLESVKEFAEEGTEMHHCVYTNRYFLKKNVLILSARDSNNNRLETIEVNLDTLNIVQSRAVCNGQTKQHDRIIEIVKNNINLIKKRMVS